MDFTRQPIIETIITPREGYKLVIRSSKSSGQEEHFVDAVEVVSLGQLLFFRSLERPKPFIVPGNDYEVVEVREARVALKNVGAERPSRTPPPSPSVKVPKEPVIVEQKPRPEAQGPRPEAGEADTSAQGDKRRDRRRGNRRREREEPTGETKSAVAPSGETGAAVEVTEEAKSAAPPPPRKTLLPPPPTLISETLARYKDSAMFKDAFYVKEHELPKETIETAETVAPAEHAPPEVHQEDVLEAIEMQNVSLELPEPVDFEFTDENETTWPFSFPDENGEKSETPAKE